MGFYKHIAKALIDKGRLENQLIVLQNVEFVLSTPIERDIALEDLININMNHKFNYIVKTYYSGEIKKKNPCILSITDSEIHFRSARLFPTFYLDLLVIAHKYRGKTVTLKFDRLFIGYHCLALQKRYPDLHSPNFDALCIHWRKRFTNEQMTMSFLKKFQSFLLAKRVI